MSFGMRIQTGGPFAAIGTCDTRDSAIRNSNEYHLTGETACLAAGMGPAKIN